MERPNLFDYATSELSQDAFLAWLLAWADSRCKDLDTDLHDLGVRFASALLKLRDLDAVTPEALTVHVQRQVCRVDVVAEINDNLVIAIEDKTVTCLHEGNLKALNKLKERYQGRDVLAVYLKTGDESSFDSVESYGFRPFRRANFLALLRTNNRLLRRNAIVSDFHALLEKRETAVGAWRYEAVADWTKKTTPWIGFFEHLRAIFPDLSWGYVPNPNGGFLGAWWHWRKWNGSQIYLQINQGPLQFRMMGPEATSSQAKIPATAALCHNAFAALLSLTPVSCMPITKTHLKPGQTMAFAQIARTAWMAVGADACIDLPQTIERLQEVSRMADKIKADKPALPVST